MFDWIWSRDAKQTQNWAALVKIREARIAELEAEARSDAERIERLDSDLATLKGQHANTQEANRAIAAERDAAVRELKVRADLILQHGRKIAELQAQNERLLRDNRSAITTSEAALANATALQAKCEGLLAALEDAKQHHYRLVAERDAINAECHRALNDRDNAQSLLRQIRREITDTLGDRTIPPRVAASATAPIPKEDS